MDRKKLGRLAQAAVVKDLIAHDYVPYQPLVENTEVDLLAIKDQKVVRISVKGTAVQVGNSWAVTLKTVSRRKDNKVSIKKFDRNSVDILAVFIQPLDKVLLLDARKIDSINEVRIKEDDGRQIGEQTGKVPEQPAKLIAPEKV